MVGKIVSRCHEGICWKTKTLGFFSHAFVKQEVQITMVELFQQGLDENLFKSHIDYAVRDVFRIMLDLWRNYTKMSKLGEVGWQSLHSVHTQTIVRKSVD